MRKSILALVATVMVTAACKKDRTCSCTVPANGSVPEQKYTFLMEDSKKRSAKNSCQVANDYYQLQGGSCELVK